jgi:hypothetical protein
MILDSQQQKEIILTALNNVNALRGNRQQMRETLNALEDVIDAVEEAKIEAKQPEILNDKNEQQKLLQVAKG